jgi:capsular polysaccharide transport system permease protein
VAKARVELRHIVLVASFLLCVLVPATVTGVYLWGWAAPQYASTVGFSVRREEGGSAIDRLAGLTAISGTSSSDTDILFQFLQSQRLVTDLDAQLDLRAIWSKPESDPWFAFNGGATEDLVDYWSRMVQVAYDKGSGLIEVRVLAFDPDDATRVAQALFDESARMINELSAIAREDSIRFARIDLDEAIDRLKEAREAVAVFRNRHQLVDPRIDLQNQGGLLGSLQAQLSAALIEYDLLRDTVRADDPRIVQVQRRIEVIETRIADERSKIGLTVPGDTLGLQDPDSNVFAALVGEFERLTVDLEFAERTYVAALTTYGGALAEARRQSRYLAAYAQPTRAETSRFPERGQLFGLVTLFLFIAWAITALTAYALKYQR